MLRKHKSTSHWCTWCESRWAEWQEQDATKPGELWTKESFSSHITHILDNNMHLSVAEQKGISSKVHYKYISPCKFVPPLLHTQIESVNDIFAKFVDCIDDKVEKISGNKKLAHTELMNAKQHLVESTIIKADATKITAVEVKKSRAEVWLLQQ